MRTLVAILALSPAMLFAQTNTPAQPVSTPMLQSNLVSAVSATSAGSTVTAAHRISTGVKSPKLIHSVALQQRSRYLSGHIASPRTVVVNMTVDASGKPGNLKLAKVADFETDNEVLEAVSQFRYEPATVSGVAVPVDVTLTYNIDVAN